MKINKLLFIFFIFIVTGIYLWGDSARRFDWFGLNGYSYSDVVGGTQRFIVFNDANKRNLIVIEAMVKKYYVIGDLIFVARQPVEYVKKDKHLEINLLKGVCEYWKIDTKKRIVRKIEKPENIDISCS